VTDLTAATWLAEGDQDGCDDVVSLPRSRLASMRTANIAAPYSSRAAANDPTPMVHHAQALDSE
jgi:hypothetical protein